MPKNFDNPDEAVAIARAYAKYRERKLLGINRETQDALKEDTEQQNDKAE